MYIDFMKGGIRLKIAICDDSSDALSFLSDGISAHPLSKNFSIGSFSSPKSLLDTVENSTAFDLIFLDVDMPEMNGIELGKRLREFLPKCYIVFVTNYPQYAIDAYECEAYHYLLKPVNINKLHVILDKICRNYKNENAEYVIRGRFENVRVLIKDILYVEYSDKHLHFHMDDSEKNTYEIKGGLTETHEKLKMFGFFKCHEAFTVNLSKISRFDGYEAVLVNGDRIPISVRNKTALLVAYTNYYEGK